MWMSARPRLNVDVDIDTAGPSNRAPPTTPTTSRPQRTSPQDPLTKGMTDVERHAELTYAESLFEKALLGIVYSGDWLAFVKEALKMRTTIGIYRQLGVYLDEVHSDGTNPSIGRHFRSGVYLGVGMCNIILSLISGKLATLLSRQPNIRAPDAMRTGGWANCEKIIPADEESVRRSVCDMALLIFHLVLSSFTVEGIDISGHAPHPRLEPRPSRLQTLTDDDLSPVVVLSPPRGRFMPSPASRESQRLAGSVELSAFASKVTRVALEVRTEGIRGGQARG
ncbi:hypothetical protein H0H92_015737 [Tricholoma furcatifolium]|nr:hypothetical protein H0H92_015737 [Tricholoma furcatifolium]